jgi:23S rRNA pseudouridine2605 synthase
VLILTNDGELSQRLMHPKYGVQKVYKATLNKNFKGEHLWELANGLELEDGFMKPDAVVMPDPAHKNEVMVELHSGRNRIVHRLFEALVYAGFNKKGMKRGEWRELNAREVAQLKKQVQL